MELVGAHLVRISRTRPYSTWSDLWKFISGETTRFHPEILQFPGLGGEDVVAKHTRKRWKFRRSLWRVAGAMGGCSGSCPVDSSSTPSRSTAQSRFRRSTSSSMKSLTKFQNWALYCMTTHATCGCTQKNRSTYQISHFVFPIHACVGSWTVSTSKDKVDHCYLIEFVLWFLPCLQQHLPNHTSDMRFSLQIIFHKS